MDPVKINLATFEYYDKRVASVAFAIVAMVLVGISLYNVTQGIRYREQILAFKGKIARLEKSLSKRKQVRERIQKTLKGEEMQVIRHDAQMVNRIIAKEAFPWDRLLDAVETATPNKVVLSNFEVAKDFRSITLKGVAASSKDLSLLLSNLKKSGIFKKTLLTKLSVGETANSPRPDPAKGGVTFEIETTLNMGKLFSGKEYEPFADVLKESFQTKRPQ